MVLFSVGIICFSKDLRIHHHPRVLVSRGLYKAVTLLFTSALRAMCSMCGNSADFSIVLHDFILSNSIWYCRIQLPAVSKQRDVRWCSFRWSIPLSIEYVWNSSIDRLSRLLHAHIAYEIDTAKVVAAFWRIYYFLHDLIRLKSIVSHVQTTRSTMMWFSMIDSISIDYVRSVYIDKAS